MAATAWQVYNKFKEYMGDNTIDMDAAIFKMSLVKGGTTVSDKTLSQWQQLSAIEVASGNGYVGNGRTVSGATWGAGASAGQTRFAAPNDVIWTATGGAIQSIKYAVIFVSSPTSAGLEKLVCWSRLSSTQFSMASTNTLTISAGGSAIFNLT